MAAPSDLIPTFVGYISSTQDALLLIQQCIDGSKHHVRRRAHDREREELIRSGHCFLYEESRSGIKRWTDGISWSPSRILGNFLVYRELSEPFPPGEKKKALKKNKQDHHSTTGAQNTSEIDPSTGLTRDRARSLVGSLVDSYGFKKGGLVKKTISVKQGDTIHHMVSYYTVDDVVTNQLTTPSDDPQIKHTRIEQALIEGQSFRTGIHEQSGLLNNEPNNPAMHMPNNHRSQYRSLSSYEMTSNQLPNNLHHST
ncbi:Gti1/Pac2 family-domain-containing protein [Calycina marina]|uniref:Gti1/Pac2 family-domain-containing protein n=1 Tax=Calycina marina TaxID=1763456 RepID=A0A9P7YYL7_9HELO|nr:Gti1/Pac2 family-domain-containing protein [Calycina marina]